MTPKTLAPILFLLVVILAGGSLIVVAGMHWLGVAVLVAASVIYGVFLGKSRQTGTRG